MRSVAFGDDAEGALAADHQVADRWADRAARHRPHSSGVAVRLPPALSPTTMSSILP